ncbi:MAG: zinc ABC transporter ATP-binding protein ZnuC [Gammaproteobacteria bacterium]|nr:zinc ABC transporter ATP-binding protein ZnuC [Gammaproteobacteria bacterium]
MISARGLCAAYAQREVLHAIDLQVRSGEIVTLIGPNGAGKSTLVRLVLGLLAPSAGQLWVKPRLTIGYMPQRLKLDESLPLTVGCFLGLSGVNDRSRLADAAAELGIAHLLLQPMAGLSGGETQRVLLARALVRQPQLLVLDEPVQGVDVSGQAELYALISRIRDRLQCGVLMVSHDLHLVMESTDTVLCINQHLCCSGHPEAISQHPAYLELFGANAVRGLAVYTHHHNHRHDLHGNVIEERRAGDG